MTRPLNTLANLIAWALITPADTAARVWLYLGGLADRVDTRLASRLGGED